MSLIQLLPIGSANVGVLGDLRAALSAEFSAPCEILQTTLNPEPSFHVDRQQYYSTHILERMQAYLALSSWRLLAITSVDLYIPILTFVFGESQLNGPCAVVSLHRLRQEFYGLPPDPQRLSERLLKEAIHELGHTLGLIHCENYRCVMAAAHAVESIDLKSTTFCVDCRARLRPALSPCSIAPR
jgi:archaemetzincin